MRQICDDAIFLLESGVDFVQATILTSSGSVPRGAGACMLILRDSSIRGTVGGGAIEAGIIKTAPEIFEQKRERILDIVLDGNDAIATGMICGGSAMVSMKYFDASPANLSYYERMKSENNDGTVYIFGAGHCGEKLAHVLYTVGFHTVIIDDRVQFANSERFPDADEILVPESMDLAFNEIEFDEDSYIVIVTRGHAHDELVLRGAMRTRAGYIGMIGSRKKRDSIYERMMADGYTGFDKVSSPIGIPIGDETPEEIAVSISAELIKVRADRRRAIS